METMLKIDELVEMITATSSLSGNSKEQLLEKAAEVKNEFTKVKEDLKAAEASLTRALRQRWE